MPKRNNSSVETRQTKRVKKDVPVKLTKSFSINGSPRPNVFLPRKLTETPPVDSPGPVDISDIDKELLDTELMEFLDESFGPDSRTDYEVIADEMNEMIADISKKPAPRQHWLETCIGGFLQHITVTYGQSSVPLLTMSLPRFLEYVKETEGKRVVALKLSP